MRLRKLLADFAFLGVGHFASKGIAFGSAIFLARQLRPDAVGHYAVAIAVLGYAQAFTNWGSDALGIRAVARDPESAAPLAGNVSRVRLALGAIAACGLLALTLGGILSLATVVPMVVCLLALVFRRDWFLLGRCKPKRVGVALAAREVVFLAAVLWILVVRPTLSVALWCVAGAELAWTMATMLLAGRLLSCQRTSATTRFLLIEGWPIAIVSLTVLTNNKIDIPLLGHFRSASEVGSYWGAYNVMFAFMAVAALLTRAALPEMSRQAQFTAQQGAGSSFRLAILGGAGGCIAALLLTRYAGELIKVVYAGRLSGGGDALGILALALPGHFLGAVLVGRLVAEGRQHEWTVAAVTAAVANLSLNLWLIPHMGLRGAAWATVASEWILMLVVVFSFRKHSLHKVLVINYAVIAGCFLLGLGAFWLSGNRDAGLFSGAGVVLAATILTLVAAQKVPGWMRLATPTGA